MQKEIGYSELSHSDLIIDALYKGGSNKNTSDDPISKLVNVGNQGGFRYKGSASDISKCKLVVLYTSLGDIDWPDFIDLESGSFTYYGDNKTPGHELHDTPRNGNLLLRNIFDAYHSNNRSIVPPIFIFSKGLGGRDVVFRGLCVPGFHGYAQSEDLVAVWKTQGNQRFQNYRAIFSILNIPVLSRNWLNGILNGTVLDSKTCPVEFTRWILSGNASVLASQKTRAYRTRQEQTPEGDDLILIETIHSFFETNPHGFEKCAAEIAMLMDKNFVSYDLTRPWLDGGRDAIGNYKIGNEHTSIKVEYALEAKCYAIENAVGVKETSRLISRIRHRQFGILVTTSYIHIQAYKEIIDDGHPVILICGKDIINILKKSAIRSQQEILDWLNSLKD